MLPSLPCHQMSKPVEINFSHIPCVLQFSPAVFCGEKVQVICENTILQVPVSAIIALHVVSAWVNSCTCFQHHWELKLLKLRVCVYGSNAKRGHSEILWDHFIWSMLHTVISENAKAVRKHRLASFVQIKPQWALFFNRLIHYLIEQWFSTFYPQGTPP